MFIMSTVTISSLIPQVQIGNTVSSLFDNNLEQLFETYFQIIGLEPTTFTVDIQRDGERLLGTCLELKNIFVDGTNKEDIIRKMRIVIEEFLKSQDVENKSFNLNEKDNLEK